MAQGTSWTGHEVPLDFIDDDYVSGLNHRIREEGKFSKRSNRGPAESPRLRYDALCRPALTRAA